MLQGLTILFTVGTITLMAALSEWRCMNNLCHISNDIGSRAISVYRGDKDTTSIQCRQLVVGDIIRLDIGTIIPADCILIHSGHPRYDSIDKRTKIEKSMKCPSEIIMVNERDVTCDQTY